MPSPRLHIIREKGIHEGLSQNFSFWENNLGFGGESGVRIAFSVAFS
jgi:hypothetical protein